jgi:hypothetical protein
VDCGHSRREHLSKALAKLEASTNSHGALKKVFQAIYGFSSDEPVLPAMGYRNTWQRDARHGDHRWERVHPASNGNQAINRTGRTQMKTISTRELSAAELDAVSGGSPNLTVPAGTFDKLFAAIDKNLEMVKQLPKGGYLPPG